MKPVHFEWAATLFTGLVVVSVGVALAGLTWRVAGYSGLSQEADLVAAPATAAPRIDVGPIVAAAPFGTAAATPATGGTLQLQAILFAEPRAASSIVVAANGGPALTYAIGATLPNGAILDAVERDRAVLRTGGGTQILAFPLAPGGNGAASSAGDVAAIRALIPAAAQGVAPGAPLAAGASPQGLLDGLGIAPAPGGYRVGPAPSPQLRAAGLLPGDVIARVNGNAVGNPQTDQSLFGAALASGNAQIQIVRDGKQMSLSLAK